jgi:hypothetical protein
MSSSKKVAITKQNVRDMKSPTVNCDLITVFIIAVCVNAAAVSSTDNHCDNNRFASASSTSYMQFTKETVNEEYAVEGEFKNLHCCAKGYRSIEW